jgi:general secretion pathway protein D
VTRIARRVPIVLLYLLLIGWALPTHAQQEEVVEGEYLEGEEEYIEEGEMMEEEEVAPAMPQRVQPQQAQPIRAPRPVRPRVPQGAATPPPPRSAGGPGRAKVNVRTASDAEQANGKDSSVGKDMVEFDFRDSPLYDVIESIARLTGRNFDVDPNIGATQVTLLTHEEIPVDMAYQVLESILASRGFSMVETLDGKLVKIVPTPDSTQSEKPPLVQGTDVQADSYDKYSTHLITIQHANPEELANVLKLLGSPNARVDSYLPTNTLIMTDTADGLRRMFQFIEQADIPGADSSMEIFTLEYTRAEILAQQIEAVLLEEGSGAAVAGQPNQPRQPVRTRRPTTRPVPGASTNQVIGSKEEILRMVPDERLNALITVASPGMMEQVRDLVVRLDTPTPYEANNLHVYELLNADAEQVEQALQDIAGTAPRQSNAGGGGGAAGGGAGGSAEVQPFEREIQITRYDQTNSLLVVASPQDYKVLEAFIARLDVPQRQVHVDATVMDVTINDNYNVTVDAAGLTGNDGFGLTNTANLLAVATAASGITGGDDGGGTQSVGGFTQGLATGLLGLGTDGGLTAGIFDDISINIGGQEVEVPFVPLLFQAIETVSDLEVLSQPSLVTVDNEEASITVGQEVPFVTNQRRPVGNQNDPNSVNNFSFNSFNSITREDVGVKLTVTPQISEGDNVFLDMELEVSDLDADQIGDVNLLGPTTNKSLVQNKVLVKDGATAVLAGLIRDTANRRRNQTPIAGDLPVIGWLFRSKSNNRTKRNLVVLVTPHIIKEGVEYDRITNYSVGNYYDANVEELFDQGFFKKVKKKRQDRKTHRPTFEKSQQLTGQRSSVTYGRGDIHRQ